MLTILIIILIIFQIWNIILDGQEDRVRNEDAHQADASGPGQICLQVLQFHRKPQETHDR